MSGPETSHEGLPFSRGVEEAVIGAVLVNPELYPVLADRVGAADFYLVRHRMIWQAIAALAEAKQSIDVVTIADQLQTKGHLEEVGGQGFLWGLAADTPSSLHAETYAGIVREHAGKRALIRWCGRVASLAYDGHPVSEILEQARAGLAEISGAEPGNPLVDAKTLMTAIYESVGSGALAETVIPTGLAGLDKLLHGGLRPGRLYLVAGRPGGGKSALLLGIAAQAATQGRKVGLFSPEMPNEEQAGRLLAQLSGIPLQRILSRRLEDDDWPAFSRAVEQMGRLPLWFDDTAYPPVRDLADKCRRLAEKSPRGLDLLVVDSLNLLDPQMDDAQQHEKVNWLAYRLKVLARELEVPVLAAHHMSRRFEQGGEREPELADLEQAGEKPADVVAFLYPASRSGKGGKRRLKVAKQRSGPTGVVELTFQAPTLRFIDADTPREEET